MYVYAVMFIDPGCITPVPSHPHLSLCLLKLCKGVHSGLVGRAGVLGLGPSAGLLVPEAARAQGRREWAHRDGVRGPTGTA